MKIFGINFTTKKELKAQVSTLEADLNSVNEILDSYVKSYTELINMFPYKLGQTVYDVALKNAQGRYTKTKPSLEYSIITPVTIDEKNYFSIVKRSMKNDIFLTEEAAKQFLKSVCKE
jgi:hypothetical protein